MSEKIKKEDLRVTKTNKVLINAMFTILNRKNWRQVKVNDLCKEALISRATFYIHFCDKYDFLKYWLLSINKDIMKDIYKYNKFEETINKYIYENKKAIKNLLKNADDETTKIVKLSFSSIIEEIIKRESKDITDINTTILTSFCTGGCFELLLSEIENNFSSDINASLSCLYEILKNIIRCSKT